MPEAEVKSETATDQPLQGGGDAELKTDPEKEQDGKGEQPIQFLAMGSTLQHNSLHGLKEN